MIEIHDPYPPFAIAAVFFGIAAHLFQAGVSSLSFLAAILGGVGTLLLGVAALFREIRTRKRENIE